MHPSTDTNALKRDAHDLSDIYRNLLVARFGGFTGMNTRPQSFDFQNQNSPADLLGGARENFVPRRHAQSPVNDRLFLDEFQ